MFDKKNIINEELINSTLNNTRQGDKALIWEILEKAKEKKGLTMEDAGYLLNVEDEGLLRDIFQVAGRIKREIYGERLVLFAPLYVSNYCVNNCAYCGFQRSNLAPRKKLSMEEVAEQVRILENMGHKRLLVEFGEDPLNNDIDYVVSVIRRIYETKTERGEIRRVNVNIAATTVDDYKRLKEAGIGTYQLFQETYHEHTYCSVHNGPKADYARQLFSHDRAFEAGIDDVGLGVLFGLYDYKFEVLGLLSHAQYLEKRFGIGPHTISVPRWQSANAVSWQIAPHNVSEQELLKIIAILRLAVPYTGMIISTREKPEIRAKAFKIGISQTSAASRTSPGGYGENREVEQFKVADERNMEQIVFSILEQDLLPSFCTACYRLQRTGEAFMNLAKPGEIHNFCRPNAILTFKEYLEDYAGQEVKILGERVFNCYIQKITDANIKEETINRLRQIEQGKRDLFF